MMIPKAERGRYLTNLRRADAGDPAGQLAHLASKGLAGPTGSNPGFSLVRIPILGRAESLAGLAAADAG
jgi:hypothetical protein